MKNITLLFCICLLYSCTKENNIAISKSAATDNTEKVLACTKTVVEITNIINANTIWDSCKYYYVKTGITISAQLTIRQGTVIKFNSFQTIGSIQFSSGKAYAGMMA